MRMEQRIQIHPDDEFRLNRVSTAILITRRTPEGQVTSVVIEGREDQIDVVLDKLHAAYLDELAHREIMLSDVEIDDARRMAATMEEA